jgi:hypothetical protein
MVEKQVDGEIFVADLEVDLAADEREAGAELEQKLADVLNESRFDLAFVRLGAERKEVEAIRVLQALTRQVGLRTSALTARAARCWAA